ncbi:MAG: zinc-dependent alcohol dehydrogenase family protein [Proteobacteria bacterium]|jgi:alcohol dehydrogenase, propanol-preferring|nr:zinc-dependent alcohol dehydrogenase family protein [Pseudomonadota bacterium]
MKAMIFNGHLPLVPGELPLPQPSAEQVRLRITACGVCRTDLHIVDRELDDPVLPLVLGHQVVGIVDEVGSAVTTLKPGARVGVPWLGWTCGCCDYCESDRENLCDEARFTGYHLNGGFAEAAVADHRYCFEIPSGFPDEQAAPLLCAGLIGFRALRLAGSARKLGFYGFGSAAHILCQVASWQGREVFAFTRPGDTNAQEFARSLGAVWAGDSSQMPPTKLDAAIIFAPVGPLVTTALKAVAKGGRVVCAGIHMSDIPAFPYRDLWEERSIISVANLTRDDAIQFLDIAPRVPVRTKVHLFPLHQANEALEALRTGAFDGAAVITI